MSRWDKPSPEGDSSTAPKGHHPTGAELGAANGAHFTSYCLVLQAGFLFDLSVSVKILQSLDATGFSREIQTTLNCWHFSIKMS